MSESFSSFRLARMSPLILVLTLFLLAIPVVFLGTVAFGRSLLAVPALLVIAIYSWIWLGLDLVRSSLDRTRSRWNGR